MALGLARRTKIFAIDGAEFRIAPMTYAEVEEYSERKKETEEQIAKLTVPESDIPEALKAKRLENSFFVLCCGLNNANPDYVALRNQLDDRLITEDQFKEKVAPIAITSAIIRLQMDDVCAAELIRGIFAMNGFTVPREGLRRANTPGETQVGS